MRASGSNVSDFLLSTSTSSRIIEKVPTERLDEVKKDFTALMKKKFVSIHWDEKLIQEGRNFTAFERIAVFSSHRNGTK